MSEQATLEPLLEKPQREPEQVAEPAEEDVASASRASQSESNVTTASPTTPVRRSRRWPVVFCTVLAVFAAIIALAAPGLRPIVAVTADAWLGNGNLVSSFVAPEGSLNVRQMATQALNAELADYSARLDRLAAAQQATATNLSHALADLRLDQAKIGAIASTVEDLSRQTRELQLTAMSMDRRVRATGLVSLALRLRRDLDAGLPLGDDLAAINAGGPYPAEIRDALQQLSPFREGAPTMRDLADELDRVIARLAARSGVDGSWTGRSWARFAQLFGGASPSGDAALVERLRSLATDGRFTEAASEIMQSSAADDGMAWAARVRARATAVVATQSLLVYSLAAYENAFGATGAR